MHELVPPKRCGPSPSVRPRFSATPIGVWLLFVALAIMVVLAMATTVWLIVAFRDLPRSGP